MNPYLDRKAARKIGVAGRKSEAQAAKRLGMRQTPASGAATAKGDLQSGVQSIAILMEAKATEADSLSVKLDWLCKISGEAAAIGKEPALLATFIDQQGRPRRHGRWVMMTERLFQELTKEGS